MSSFDDAVFKIKSFGNDKLCRDINELVDTLMNEYRDQSVSVLYKKRDTGMTRIVFVDVEATQIRYSYGDGSVVDFQELEQEAFVVL